MHAENHKHHAAATEYYAAYAIEESLSIDNMLVVIACVLLITVIASIRWI